MAINERLLNIIKKKYSYTDEQLLSFSQNPRNEEVLSKGNELKNTILVLTVIESHGCNSQHKVGDKIFFDGGGNLLTKYSPARICSYALNNSLLLIFTANEFIFSGISPMNIKFKRCSCFDVGVNCGGFGQIILELSVMKKEDLDKEQLKKN